jgi:hypothetical protein
LQAVDNAAIYDPSSCSATLGSVVNSSTDPSAVTVTIAITFNSPMAGQTYEVESTVQDNQGRQSGLGELGTFAVQAAPIMVTVSPASATLGATQTLQLSAAVTGTNNQQVIWGVSGVGIVSSTGLYTAPATVTAQQTVTVTATSAVQSTASGSAAITLTPIPPPNIGYLSLTQGPPQMGFTIYGTNFGPPQGGGSVTLTGLPGGDVPLTVINNSWSNTSIQVQVPASTALGAGQVYVKPSGNVASNQTAFTVKGPFGCAF